MEKLVRKAFILGLGVASLTKSKLSPLAKELVRKGVSAAKSSKLVKEMEKRGASEEKKIRAFVGKEVSKAKRMALSTSQREVSRLRQKVSELERRLKGANRSRKK